MKKLEDIEKKEPFKAPEDYFDSFPDKIKSATGKRKDVKNRKTWDIVKPYLYFASFFVALAFLIKFGVSRLSDNYSVSHNKKEMISENSVYYLETISEDIIYEELSAQSENSSKNQLSDEEIEDYLVQDDNIEYLIYE